MQCDGCSTLALHTETLARGMLVALWTIACMSLVNSKNEHISITADLLSFHHYVSLNRHGCSGKLYKTEAARLQFYMQCSLHYLEVLTVYF